MAIFAWDAKSRRDFLKLEREDSHTKALNDQVRALAKVHRFKTFVREDGRMVIPCHGDLGRHGYWEPVGPDTWAFTHTYRRFPDKDIATMQAIDPRLVPFGRFEEEIVVQGPTDAALKLMSLDEPEFTSARKMRPTLSQDQIAAMAAGRARKAHQGPQNPENPPSSGTGALPHTPDPSTASAPPNEGLPAPQTPEILTTPLEPPENDQVPR